MPALHLGSEGYATDGTDGRVGIGTAAPNAPLTVVGGLAGVYYGANDRGIAIDPGVTAGVVDIYGDYIGSGSEPKLHLSTYSQKTTGNGITIDTSGKVGIGTLSPGAVLQVNGDCKLQTGAAVNEFSTDGTLAGNSDTAVPTEKAVKTYVDAGSGSFWSKTGTVVYYSNGTVGIGTTDTASAKLRVYGGYAEISNGAGSTSQLSGNTLQFSSSGATSVTTTGSSISLSKGTAYVLLGSSQTNIHDATSILLDGPGTKSLTITSTGTSVNGNFSATTKTFRIKHPDPVKTGKQLVHACLEGPEHAVFYRGFARLTNGSAEIVLPDYIIHLIDQASAMVQLTCKGGWSPLFVQSLKDGKLAVKSEKGAQDQDFYWLVIAERKDAPHLVVEVDN